MNSLNDVSILLIFALLRNPLSNNRREGGEAS